MTQHSFGFDVTIEESIAVSVEQEEYDDFSEEGESLEEYARRMAKKRAPRNLTMRIADDGISANAVEIGGKNYHDSWD